MIKFSGKRAGRPHIGLVIDAENMSRLKLGQPILFDAGLIGFDGTISLEYVETCDVETIKAIRARVVEAKG